MLDPKYVLRVTGLGSVIASMLDNARTDEDARRDITTCLRSDPRMKVHALYRVQCLQDSLGDDKDHPLLDIVFGEIDGKLYLATGAAGKDLLQSFFVADDMWVALAHLLELSWTKTRLYQLKKVPL